MKASILGLCLLTASAPGAFASQKEASSSCCE